MIKPEHKKQLHDRIVERSTLLKATLATLQAVPQNAKSERARAVEEALAALETHLSGGWEKIDEPESAALTRWLESSQFLFDTKPAIVVNTASVMITPPSSPSDEKMQS